MYWQELIANFPELTRTLLSSDAISLNKLADFLGRHKKTVAAWPRGTPPSDQSDIAWVIRKALETRIDISRFQTFAPIYDFSPMLAYEEKAQKEPPDLSWLTTIQSPPPVKVKFCGLDLDCPLGVSSSPLLSDDRWTAMVLDLGFGLSTFKTRRRGSKRSWDPPQIAFVSNPPNLREYDRKVPPEVFVTFNRSEVADAIPNLVNCIGAPSETAVMWQETYERIRRHPRGRFVGISVMGEGRSRAEYVKEFKEVTAQAKEVEPPFVELNPSCPNLKNQINVWDEPRLLKKICTDARQILSTKDIRLILKLPYLTGDSLRQVVKTIGGLVDAVTFCNTLSVKPLTFDHRDGSVLNAFPGRDFGGLSGPCTFEVVLKGLRNLIQIREELQYRFGVIAVGGATTPSDVIEYLNVGADIVQVCTAAMFDPLLAWKIRFHMRQFEFELSSSDAADLLWPRNESETLSFRNAYEAVRQIQARGTQWNVPWDVFQTKWNEWMQQQPTMPVGRAHRLPQPRTVSQWIREFTQ